MNIQNQFKNPDEFLKRIGMKIKINYTFCVLMILNSAMLFLKLVFSYNVYGTNDVSYWINFSDIIEKFGTLRIYDLVPIYNHPPLMSWILKLIRFIGVKTHLTFPFLFRLMPILADYAGIFVIWELLGKYNIKNRVLICVVCIINPINFLVSGFHGNTDPVFVFFILLAIYFSEKNKFILSGIFYGLSVCVKIVPAVLIPLFLFYFKEKKAKKYFFLSSLALPAVVFFPYVFGERYFFIKNIFLYSGLKGIWGLGHILSSLFNTMDFNMYVRYPAYILFKLHVIFGVVIFFLLNVILSRCIMDNKNSNLLEGCFLVFCLFLAVTPGFGVQYLSWLSLFAVVSADIWGMIFILIGGLFLYRVYIYWNGGLPLYYANSDSVGQWIGFERKLDIVVWLIIVIMLIKFLSKRMKFCAFYRTDNA